LQRRGLAKNFRHFKHRWWSNRWRTWLFCSEINGGWYFFSQGCDCFVPAECIGYDVPEPCEGQDECSCAPRQAMQCQVLPPDNEECPQEPQNVPPPLPGVNDNDNDNQPSGGCCCCKCKKPGGKPCGKEGCGCSRE
jgi:hypothetical protein